MWLGPLRVCLAEQITSLVEGPYLPGGTVLHDLVYGCAADASLEPEWLVITDGQQPGSWRLLHNSFQSNDVAWKLPTLSTNTKRT